MLMVIFGAGASYDSCPTYPPGGRVPSGGEPHNNFNRLPLANQLFEDRPLFAEAIERYPDCQPIVPRLRSLVSETLEAALEDLQTKAETYPRGVRQLAAIRYYLQYVIRMSESRWHGVARGVSNYMTLLDEIERAHKPKEPVCLVTFNYDTLLDAALSDFGLEVTTFTDYTRKHEFYKLFKLHGSVNWAREIDTKLSIANPGHTPTVAKEVIAHANELQVSDNYALAAEIPVGLVNGKPGFPAIAIPVEKKRSFECPQQMLDDFTALLPQVSRILVIGWRATEAHFLALLKAKLPDRLRLEVVAGSGKSEAEDAKVRIMRELANNRTISPSTYEGGFTYFILNRLAEKYLAS